MKIGIDAHILGKGKGGVERYVTELCARLPSLAPDDSFYFFITKDYQPLHFPANVNWIPLKITDPLLQRSIILPWLIKKLNLDLIHTQRIAPLFSSCPVIVSIHDILPLTQPDDYTGLRHNVIRLLTGRTTKQAQTIITVSLSVKKEIEQTLPQASGKVKTIYNGVDHSFFKPAVSSTHRPVAEDYILYTGAIEPRKNLQTVLDAYALVSAEYGKTLAMVFVGMDRDKDYARLLHRQAENSSQPNQIIFTGYLTEEQALHYLQHASIFLAPSKGEGFDLPPLEAMACNIPVICSAIVVHYELFKNSALFFKTDSPQDLAKAILKLYKNKDLSHTLQKRGTTCTTRFSWEKTICQILKTYKENEPCKKD